MYVSCLKEEILKLLKFYSSFLDTFITFDTNLLLKMSLKSMVHGT